MLGRRIPKQQVYGLPVHGKASLWVGREAEYKTCLQEISLARCFGFDPPGVTLVMPAGPSLRLQAVFSLDQLQTFIGIAPQR